MRLTQRMRDSLGDVFDEAIKQGWEIRKGRRGGHFALVPPDKSKPFVYCAGTPSDAWRTRANVLAQMRKSGFDDGRNPGSVG